MTDQTLPTALNLPMVDPLPHETQKYFDICVEKLGFCAQCAEGVCL